MTDTPPNVIPMPGQGGQVQWADSFVNLLAGLGVPGRDKFASQQYTFTPMSVQDLEFAYRGDWVARKAVTIPAWDMTREWRKWQADPDQITLLEAAEKKLSIQAKVQQALIKARLYGGAAIIIGVDAGKPEEELDLELVTQDSLKFIHVVSKHSITAGPIIYDISSKYFGQPEYYEARNTPASRNFQQAEPPDPQFGGKQQVRLHPSRVVKLIGVDTADQLLTDIWGDSVLQAVNDSIKMCGLVTGSLATLVAEMKVDVIKIPELKTILSTKDGERKMIARFQAANVAKSVVNTVLIDGNEEWQRISASLNGFDQIVVTYMQVAAGAVDIPAGRFLGLPHRGLNVTGEADFRNYYDRLASEQKVTLEPAMTTLDEVMIRSALGERPPEVWYEWESLWQLDDAEKADLALKKAQIYQIDVNCAQLPPTALANARANQLIEDGVYPGLEKALDDAALEGDTIEEQAGTPAMHPAMEAMQTLAQHGVVQPPGQPGGPPGQPFGGGAPGGLPGAMPPALAMIKGGKDASPFGSVDGNECHDPNSGEFCGEGGGVGGGSAGGDKRFHLSFEYTHPEKGWKNTGNQVVMAPHLEAAAKKIMTERNLKEVTITKRHSMGQAASEAEVIGKTFSNPQHKPPPPKSAPTPTLKRRKRAVRKDGFSDYNEKHDPHSGEFAAGEGGGAAAIASAASGKKATGKKAGGLKARIDKLVATHGATISKTLKSHSKQALATAVTFGLYHIAGADFPADVEHAIHHEVMHLADNLGVAKTIAVGHMKNAVAHLRKMHGALKKDAADDHAKLAEALAKLAAMLDKLEARYREEEKGGNGKGNGKGVSDFNPNHDPDGKFASGQGGGVAYIGTTGTGKSRERYHVATGEVDDPERSMSVSEEAAARREPHHPEHIAEYEHNPIDYSRPYEKRQESASKLSKDEYDAARSVVGDRRMGQGETGTYAINNALRHGGPMSPQLKKKLGDLQTAFDKTAAPITDYHTKKPKEAWVYRGISHKVDLKVGDEYQDNGYISTTRSEHVAANFARRVKGGTLIKITVPAGHKVLPVRDVGHQEQGEIVMRSKTKFRVTKVRGKNIEMTVIG